MNNKCEFVIAYYDEKNIVLGANVRLVKLLNRQPTASRTRTHDLAVTGRAR